MKFNVNFFRRFHEFRSTTSYQTKIIEFDIIKKNLCKKFYPRIFNKIVSERRTSRR